MIYLACILVTGVGATAITDAWSILRKVVFRVPPPDFGLVGRWFAYMRRGRFHHESIKAAPPVNGERYIGWTMHYVIGIVFAALLGAVDGNEWFEHPTLLPALIVGAATVVAPFFLMQPGMGAGVAASRTPNPTSARIHSVVTHTIFGTGLYIAGCAARFLVI